MTRAPGPGFAVPSVDGHARMEFGSSHRPPISDDVVLLVRTGTSNSSFLLDPEQAGLLATLLRDTTPGAWWGCRAPGDRATALRLTTGQVEVRIEWEGRRHAAVISHEAAVAAAEWLDRWVENSWSPQMLARRPAAPRFTAERWAPPTILNEALRRDDLEFWRHLAMVQAEQIAANSDRIRELCAERGSWEPMVSCPLHGARVRALSDEHRRLDEEETRVDLARAGLAIAFNGMEFLDPRVSRIPTYGRLAEWSRRIRAVTAARAAGDPEPDFRPKRERPPTGRKDLSEWVPPEGWVDPASKPGYWREIARSQATDLQDHPDVAARIGAERDKNWARLASCATHVDHIAGLNEAIAYEKHRLSATTRAYRILDDAVAELHAWAAGSDTPDEQVPADQWADRVKGIKRANGRAYQAWQKPFAGAKPAGGEPAGADVTAITCAQPALFDLGAPEEKAS